MENRAVYKLDIDCGRQGNLRGLFIAKKSHVDLLLSLGIKVYFGEVLGKYSEIYGEINSDEITLVSDESNVIDIIEKHGLENGFNPFDYNVINHYRDEFNSLTVGEVCEIIEKEIEQGIYE